MEITYAGAFDGFLSGTGLVAGDPYSHDPLIQDAASRLKAAMDDRATRRRGRGYSVTLTGMTRNTLIVLWELADACLDANSDEPEASEVRAAREVIARIDEALGQRVDHDTHWGVE